MAGNYPAGVTDMDERFDTPNAHEGEEDTALYGLVLDVYDGQPMNMPVFDNCSRPLALTLEEIQDAQREYATRNPKGVYSIVPIERVNRMAQERMDQLGITEEDIEETRFPTEWPA